MTDAASLRAVSELTAAGGFLGAISLDGQSPDSPIVFYRRGLDEIYSTQTFRSVLSGSVCAVCNRWFIWLSNSQRFVVARAHQSIVSVAFDVNALGI